VTDVLLHIIDLSPAGVSGEAIEQRLEYDLRDCDGVLVLYSVASRPSFDEMTDRHSRILRLQKERDDGLLTVLVLGDECDVEGERQIQRQEGEALARHLGFEFVKLSAG
jgi:GTPase KRas protein